MGYLWPNLLTKNIMNLQSEPVLMWQKNFWCVRYIPDVIRMDHVHSWCDNAKSDHITIKIWCNMIRIWWLLAVIPETNEAHSIYCESIESLLHKVPEHWQLVYMRCFWCIRQIAMIHQPVFWWGESLISGSDGKFMIFFLQSVFVGLLSQDLLHW